VSSLCPADGRSAGNTADDEADGGYKVISRLIADQDEGEWLAAFIGTNSSAGAPSGTVQQDRMPACVATLPIQGWLLYLWQAIGFGIAELA
jgi:hypothetical protein